MASRLLLRSSTTRRGIRIKKRVTRFLRRIFRHRHRNTIKVNALSRTLRRWGTKLRGIKLLRFGPGSGYARLDRVRDESGAAVAATVPKGHLAVYVGRKEEEGWSERVVVPVVYFNHPLFGRLLREAEEKYGFDHPGGITIPCHVSEFQSIQTTIAAARGRSSRRWC